MLAVEIVLCDDVQYNTNRNIVSTRTQCIAFYLMSILYHVMTHCD